MQQNNVQLIISITIIFYVLAVAMYFICSQKKIDDKDRFSLKFILTTISAPVVILSIAIIIITLLNNQKIKKLSQTYDKIQQNINVESFNNPNDNSNDNSNDNPNDNSNNNSNDNRKINAEGLGEALKEAGWRVVLADWCGFCKKQKAFFAEYPEGNFESIIITEDEAANDKEINSRIQGYPAWINVKDITKDSPGFKSTIGDCVELLNM